MSNIYEFVNFVFVPLCDVANISICDYFDFRFFFEKSIFFSWCIELRNMEIMK